MPPPPESPSRQCPFAASVLTRRRLAGALALQAGLGPGALAVPLSVRVATGEWSPFMSEALPHRGFVLQIVQEAFAHEGVRVEFVFLPWARAMLQVQTGSCEASAAWYATAERLEKFHFSEPLFVEQQVLFHRRREPLNWKTVDDLKGLRLGATVGYVYGEAFQAAEHAGLLRVDRAPSDEKNLRKLLLGRVDAVAVSLAVGLDLLRRNFSPEEAGALTYAPRPLNAGPLHLIFAKTAQGLGWRQTFDRGMLALQKGGRSAAIISRALKP